MPPRHSCFLAKMSTLKPCLDLFKGPDAEGCVFGMDGVELFVAELESVKFNVVQSRKQLECRFYKS